MKKQVRSAFDITYEIRKYFAENNSTDFLYTSSEKGDFITFNYNKMYLKLDRLDINIVRKITDNPTKYLIFFRNFLIEKFKITDKELKNITESEVTIEYDYHDDDFFNEYFTAEMVLAKINF